MISLQNFCSLPIELEDTDNEFHLKMSGCIKCKTKKTISLESIVPTLLNRSIKYPKNVYEEYSVCLEEDEQVFSNGLNYDLLVIPPGLLGIEFIKSHTYYSPESSIRSKIRFSSIVEALNATTTIIMQKILPPFDPNDLPSIEEGILVELKAGEKFAIPEGYYYTFINTTDDPAIIARLYKTYSVVDYHSSDHPYTMGYFCIRKNARQELVYNPKFRGIPAIKFLSQKEAWAPTIGVSQTQSLYDLAKTKTEILKEILK